MKKTIRVEVTKADIAKGRAHNGQACPISRALQRATRRNWHVFTDWAQELDASGRDWNLPAMAKRFIRRFDNGLPVKPRGFTLTVRQ